MEKLPAVLVKNLVKKYKTSKVNAVDNISFKVAEGEFFALLGPNGAGKTTTISILTTMLSKTSGEVVVAGFDVDRNQGEVRKNVGVIFQKPCIDLNLTAEENIRFHTLLFGMYKFKPAFSLMPEAYRKRVYVLSDILGIKNEIFHPIKTFSGGMMRKLEIVRSLMHNPKILFLDEPTSGLDPFSRKNLWQYLKEVRKTQKTTIFLTTHYLEEAEDADNVCIVNNGKIVSYGTPDKIKKELTREYLLVNSDNRDLLRRELKEKKLKFDEDGIFKIYIQNRDIPKIIKNLTTKLTMIKTHTPTLEDAYLEIIKQDE